MNPDPLDVIRWHAEPVRAAHHRRVGFAIGLVAGIVVTLILTGAGRVAASSAARVSIPADSWKEVRPVPDYTVAPVTFPAAASKQSAASASVPGLIVDPFPVSPPPERAAVAVPSPELHVVSKAPVVPQGGNSVTGTASWGDGWSGVVTRLPRGTAICVVGPLGRWCGASVGYGPATWTGRIADLSRAVFGDICGPVSAGLCTVTVTW